MSRDALRETVKKGELTVLIISRFNILQYSVQEYLTTITGKINLATAAERIIEQYSISNTLEQFWRRGKNFHFTRKSYSANLRKINEDNLRFSKANLSGKVIEESFRVIESCVALDVVRTETRVDRLPIKRARRYCYIIIFLSGRSSMRTD